MRRSSSFSKLRASIRRSSAKLMQKLVTQGRSEGPLTLGMGGSWGSPSPTSPYGSTPGFGLADADQQHGISMKRASSMFVLSGHFHEQGPVTNLMSMRSRTASSEYLRSKGGT